LAAASPPPVSSGTPADGKAGVPTVALFLALPQHEYDNADDDDTAKHYQRYVFT
jgi:hypothetical protein